MPELCTESFKLDCPGQAPPCAGACLLRVCARYDTIPDSPHITNLTVTFHARPHAPPYTNAALLERAVAACRGGFNAGRGFIEYVDAAGNRHRLDQDSMSKAMEAHGQSLSAEDRDRRDRLVASGHCARWDARDRAWMTGTCCPPRAGGWNLRWGCQLVEGQTGLSIRELSADTEGPIQSFELDFVIDAVCACLRGPVNQAQMTVQLKYP